MMTWQRQQLTWHDMTCVILCKTMDGGCDVIWVGTFWVLAGLIIVGMCECLSLSGTHIHVMHYIWGNHVIRIFAATRFSRTWILISRYVPYTMHHPFWVEVYTCLVYEGWKRKNNHHCHYIQVNWYVTCMIMLLAPTWPLHHNMLASLQLIYIFQNWPTTLLKIWDLCNNISRP